MMQKRVLGRTGAELSVIGFGGIVVCNETPSAAADHVARAIDRGINYFDVAPTYGNSEERLGPALAPYRKDVFLACKTAKRDAASAREQLHASLKLLQTDHFDIYQIHGVPSLEEAEQVLAPGGALETLIAAREQGLIRHIGFSAHSEEAALRLLDAFPFDSMLFPINIFCWQEGKFGPKACAKAMEKGAGILALKTLAKRCRIEGEPKQWPKCWYVPIDEPAAARRALAFTLSQPVTAAVSPSHAELLWLMCDALEALGKEPWDMPDATTMEGAPLFKAEAE